MFYNFVSFLWTFRSPKISLFLARSDFMQSLGFPHVLYTTMVDLSKSTVKSSVRFVKQFTSILFLVLAKAEIFFP